MIRWNFGYPKGKEDFYSMQVPISAKKCHRNGEGYSQKRRVAIEIFFNVKQTLR